MELKHFSRLAEQVQTAALTLAPDLINLGGNNWQVTLTNVNDASVTVSSLVYGFDDPGNPYGGGYEPGGALVSITPPTTPLLSGQTLTEDFTASPNFMVSFSDVIALASDPSDRHCHVWTAPADQGLFRRCAGRECGHVFGLLLRRIGSACLGPCAAMTPTSVKWPRKPFSNRVR